MASAVRATAASWGRRTDCDMAAASGTASKSRARRVNVGTTPWTIRADPRLPSRLEQTSREAWLGGRDSEQQLPQSPYKPLPPGEFDDLPGRPPLDDRQIGVMVRRLDDGVQRPRPLLGEGDATNTSCRRDSVCGNPGPTKGFLAREGGTLAKLERKSEEHIWQIRNSSGRTIRRRSCAQK